MGLRGTGELSTPPLTQTWRRNRYRGQQVSGSAGQRVSVSVGQRRPVAALSNLGGWLQKSQGCKQLDWWVWSSCRPSLVVACLSVRAQKCALRVSRCLSLYLSCCPARYLWPPLNSLCLTLLVDCGVTHCCLFQLAIRTE